MKRFLLPLLALCFLAPNVSAQDEKKAPEPFIQEMANGLQVQVYDTDTMATDTTDMLGIRFWKILFSTKQAGKYLKTNLEVRTPGKDLSMQGGGGISIPLTGKADLIFGIQSIGGNSLTTSPEIRLYTRLGEHKGSESRNPGNFVTISNPFLDMDGYNIRQTPLVRADGSVVLIEFSRSGKKDDPKNSELVVVATLQDPPPAK